VRSLPIVVLDPGGDLEPGMGHAEEQRFVEQFVAHAAVKAFDVAVLHRLARSDVMPIHPDLAEPREHAIAGELGAVVADNHYGLAALADQPGPLCCEAHLRVHQHHQINRPRQLEVQYQASGFLARRGGRAAFPLSGGQASPDNVQPEIDR
jgi:hypothetical protein